MSANSQNPVERPVPHDERAEQSVIGSLLLNRDAIVYVAPYLHADDFYFDRYRWCYEAIVSLYDQRTPADLTTLANALDRAGRLDAFGGHAALIALVNKTPTAAHVEYYAHIVEREAMLRRLISAGGEIAALGYDRESDPLDVMGSAVRKLATVQRTVGKPVATGEVMGESLRSRLDVAHIPGIPTGWAEFDSLTGGLHRGEMTTWAARPGRGKTSCGLNLALNAAALSCPWAVGEPRNFRGLILSFEMPRERLEDRLGSILSGVDVTSVRKGRVLNSADRAAVEDAADRLSELGLYVEDTGGIDIRGVVLKITETKLRHDIDFVVVDYLQLIKGTNRRRDDLRQQLVEVTHELKQAAIANDVAVFALAQLSRETEKRSNGEPEIQDLKESGSIEEDSDVVVLAWRPGLVDKGVDKRVLAAKLGKNRNGPMGYLSFEFDPETQRVTEWDNYYRPTQDAGAPSLPHGRPDYVAPAPSRNGHGEEHEQEEDVLL